MPPPKLSRSSIPKRTPGNTTQKPAKKLVKRRVDSEAGLQASAGVAPRSGGTSAQDGDQVQGDAEQKSQGSNTERHRGDSETNSGASSQIGQRMSRTSVAGGYQVKGEKDSEEKSQDSQTKGIVYVQSII